MPNLPNIGFQGPGEEPDETVPEDKPGLSVSSPRDDFGLKAAEQISKQLQTLYGQLHSDAFTAPYYGVDWNSLYGLHLSKRLSNQPSGSVSVALDLFQRIRQQAPTGLGQAQSPSTREVMEILDILIEV